MKDGQIYVVKNGMYVLVGTTDEDTIVFDPTLTFVAVRTPGAQTNDGPVPGDGGDGPDPGDPGLPTGPKGPHKVDSSN